MDWGSQESNHPPITRLPTRPPEPQSHWSISVGKLLKLAAFEEKIIIIYQPDVEQVSTVIQIKQ